MSITKKAISLGTTAALIASLAATIAAPAAFAANSLSTGVTGIGTVPLGGTSGAVTVTLAEQTINSISGAGTAVVTLTNSGTASVNWTGTPVLSAPGSLGASVSVSGNVLTLSTTGWDNLNYENMVVTGLKVVVGSSGTSGTISATLTATGALTTGDFIPATTTATGTLLSYNLSGADSVNVTSQCGFAVTGGSNGTATFGSQSGVNVLVIGPETVFPGVQSLITDPLSGTHTIGEAVSQTVAWCLGGVIGTGTISDVVKVSTGVTDFEAPYTVFPGETNQHAAHIVFAETAAGYLAAGTVVTMTIATAGVTFSGAPTGAVTGATNIAIVGQSGFAFPATLSSDHKSVSFTVSTASTAVTASSDQIKVGGIYYDVASSVTGGTSISVNVTLSGGLFALPTSVVNAYVLGGVTATATPTTVYIGQNGQKTGLITVKETSAGFFTDSPLNGGPVNGQNNVFVCLQDAPYQVWDQANPPVATVTSGDLLLRNGSTFAAVGTSVAGTAEWNPYSGVWCYDWTVWSHSTVASTIVIGAPNGTAASTTGAGINVFATAPQGPVNVWLGTGSDAFNFQANQDAAAVLTIANRVFANQVLVTALSQPTIAPGTTDGMGGNIQVAETAPGQLTNDEIICVQVLPRQTTGSDAYLGGLNTAQLPIATASGGIVISNVNVSYTEDCQGNQIGGPSLPTSGTYITSFSFKIYQQSTSGTGKIVISNMHFVVPADAANGNLQVEVFGFGGNPVFMQFQSTVSNAKIGNVVPTFLDAASATGVTQTGFTLSTKVVKKGSYVTVMIKTTPAMAGAHVGIYIAKKVNGVWTKFSPHTGRIANGSGVVYYYYKAGSVAWLSIRGYFAGDSLHTAAWSNAVQVKFTK